MTEQMTDVSGKCLCGSVSYTAKAKCHDSKAHVGACHCNMCRTWSGGVLFAIEDTSDVVVTGEDNIAVYKSTDWGERCFCKTCGTNLFFRMPQYQMVVIVAGSINEQDRLTFKQQIFIDRKPHYFTFENKTAEMTEAEFMAKYASPDGASQDG